MTLPNTRAEVQAYCETNLPGWLDLDPDVQTRGIDYLLDLALEMNRAVDQWEQLPHDVWDDITTDLDPWADDAGDTPT